jgi:IclR family transcriptional regulator, acetate operon repressor
VVLLELTPFTNYYYKEFVPVVTRKKTPDHILDASGHANAILEIQHESASAALRALSVLEVLSKAQAPLSLAELAPLTKLPKPTVFRIVTMLEEAGFLVREPTSKRYCVGHRASAMASNALMHSPNFAVRRAIVEELVEQTGETCNITVPNGHTTMVLERVESSWPLRVHLVSGSVIPLYASASGKLFLGAMAKRARDRYLELVPRIPYTPNTMVDRDTLEREIASARKNGYNFDNQEYLNGINSLAVPVFGPNRKIAAAIAVQAPEMRMNSQQAQEFLPALQRAAEAVAATLDF